MSKSIGKILTNIIPEQHLWKIKLFGHWDTIIGNMKNKVIIEQINETSLTLGVSHATWAQELYFLSPILLKKINTFLKENKIKNIKFKTITFNNAFKKPSSYAQPKGNAIAEHCLTIPEHGILQTIHDTELEHALKQFCLHCKRNKPSKKEN